MEKLKSILTFYFLDEMYIHKTENHRGFICSNPNFHSLQEVIITCLACFLGRDCPRDRVCGVMKKLSELLLYHYGFFCEEGERGFFFFFFGVSQISTATELKLFL